MFVAAEMCLKQARNLIAGAKVLKDFSRKEMLEYLEMAETKLIMAELYIK